MEESEQNQLAFRRRYARLAQMECRNKKRKLWIWLPDLSLSNNDQNVIPQNRGHTERGKLKAEFYVCICVNVTPEQGEF